MCISLSQLNKQVKKNFFKKITSYFNTGAESQREEFYAKMRKQYNNRKKLLILC